MSTNPPPLSLDSSLSTWLGAEFAGAGCMRMEAWVFFRIGFLADPDCIPCSFPFLYCFSNRCLWLRQALCKSTASNSQSNEYFEICTFDSTEKSKISKSNFLRTRLGEIQINILFKSLDEVLVSVLSSHKDYMIEWFEECTKLGTEINFDL